MTDIDPSFTVKDLKRHIEQHLRTVVRESAHLSRENPADVPKLVVTSLYDDQTAIVLLDTTLVKEPSFPFWLTAAVEFMTNGDKDKNNDNDDDSHDVPELVSSFEPSMQMVPHEPCPVLAGSKARSNHWMDNTDGDLKEALRHSAGETLGKGLVDVGQLIFEIKCLANQLTPCDPLVQECLMQLTTGLCFLEGIKFVPPALKETFQFIKKRFLDILKTQTQKTPNADQIFSSNGSAASKDSKDSTDLQDGRMIVCRLAELAFQLPFDEQLLAHVQELIARIETQGPNFAPIEIHAMQTLEKSLVKALDFFKSRRYSDKKVTETDTSSHPTQQPPQDLSSVDPEIVNGLSVESRELLRTILTTGVPTSLYTQVKENGSKDDPSTIMFFFKIYKSKTNPDRSAIKQRIDQISQFGHLTFKSPPSTDTKDESRNLDTKHSDDKSKSTCDSDKPTDRWNCQTCDTPNKIDVGQCLACKEPNLINANADASASAKVRETNMYVERLRACALARARVCVLFILHLWNF